MFISRLKRGNHRGLLARVVYGSTARRDRDKSREEKNELLDYIYIYKVGLTRAQR